MNCTPTDTNVHSCLVSLSFIQALLESSQAEINNDATKLMITIASISANAACLAVRLHQFMK